MPELPKQVRFVVKLGDFILGWIVSTDLTVRYFSLVEPAGKYVPSVLQAFDAFKDHVPEEVRPWLRLEMA